MKQYNPINCDLYDQYIRFIELKIPFVFMGETVLILDIFTQEKQEFIRLSQGTILRLDKFKIEDGVITARNV
jgi:transcriptional antiterminator Rof (Rho-off)